MSNFTHESWQELVFELRESHKEHNCSTSSPVWAVQELKVIYGLDSDYSDESVWCIDGETTHAAALEFFESLEAKVRHDINDYVLSQYEQLFTDDCDEYLRDAWLDEYITNERLEWKRIYYREEWVGVQVFATRHDADRYIERQSHNHGKLRVYVESLWSSPQMKDIFQAILDGELGFTKGEAA